MARLIHLLQEPAALEWLQLASTNAWTDSSQLRRTNLDARRAGCLEEPWERIARMFNDYNEFSPQNPFPDDQRLRVFLGNPSEIAKRRGVTRSALELRTTANRAAN